MFHFEKLILPFIIRLDTTTTTNFKFGFIWNTSGFLPISIPEARPTCTHSHALLSLAFFIDLVKEIGAKALNLLQTTLKITRKSDQLEAKYILKKSNKQKIQNTQTRDGSTLDFENSNLLQTLKCKICVNRIRRISSFGFKSKTRCR